jgi:hypothetical protein
MGTKLMAAFAAIKLSEEEDKTFDDALAKVCMVVTKQNSLFTSDGEQAVRTLCSQRELHVRTHYFTLELSKTVARPKLLQIPLSLRGTDVDDIQSPLGRDPRTQLIQRCYENFQSRLTDLVKSRDSLRFERICVLKVQQTPFSQHWLKPF